MFMKVRIAGTHGRFPPIELYRASIEVGLPAFATEKGKLPHKTLIGLLHSLAAPTSGVFLSTKF
jgi:hypothetical protein